MNTSRLRYQVKQSKITTDQTISAYEICHRLISINDHSENNFYTSFNFSDNGSQQRFSAYGSLAEIAVHLSRDEIIFAFSIGDESIYTDTHHYDGVTTPYAATFSHLSQFVKKIKHYLAAYVDMPNDESHVMFFGGWKAVARRNGISELARFTLPLITVCQQDNQMILTQFLKSWSEEVSVSMLMDQNKSLPKLNSLTVLSESYASSRKEYEDELEVVIAELKSLDVSKVVVSKKKDILFKTAPNPLAFAAKLASKHGQVYDYIFHWKDEKAWVGVSPEILLTKDNTHILTKPLAGTIRFDSSTAFEDVSHTLKSDKKESKEHLFASNKIEDDLKKVCIPGSVQCTTGKDAFGVGYAVHLRSVISGDVEQAVGSFDVLSKIYPPATIWGIPEEWSGTVIKGFEKFDRGFFTGGLGYFTLSDDCNFSLVIRNGSLSGSLLEVYAGSGIVDQSIPEKEWTETETKMIPILSVLEN